MSRLLSLFLTFLKINPLTASAGLLHEEAVAGSRFVTEEGFVSDLDNHSVSANLP